MKKGNPRDLALSVLNSDSKRTGGEWSLSERWDAFPWADERDRSFAMNLVQGVRRWRLRLDCVIGRYLDFPFSKLDPAVLNILRLALFQIFFMSRVPDSAAVDEAVKQVGRISKRPYLRGFVNGLLRRICREREALEMASLRGDTIESISVYYSFPGWMVRRWVTEMGTEEAMLLMDALNRIPKLVCRTNTLKTSRDELMERLSKEGVASLKSRFAPEGLILERLRGSPDKIKAFSDGLFQIQGEAAQICSCLLAPRPGDLILDLCAGLGGKSTHMAELMGDRGTILSIDLNLERLKLLCGNAKRLGITSIQAIAADAIGDTGSPFKCLFDKILLDAPCSGLGIIAKHPEIKWKRNESDIERFAKIQMTMLSGCAGLLKPGGRLLYATCTLTREENNWVVREFLALHKEFALIPLQEECPGRVRGLVDEGGFFRTYPHRDDMEGFFAALMIRKP